MDELKEETRVSFAIPTSLHDKLIQSIPWGVRSHFFRAILELAMDRLEKVGPRSHEAIGAIICKEWDIFEARDE